MKSPRFLQALKRQKVDRTPVWFMRQAGRYLPEYRQLRERMKGFLPMCKTPEVACEITLQPLKRFDLDAAIIFSDILTIPDAMGLGLYFVANEGPQFERPIRTQMDVDKLPILNPDRDLNYVMEAMRLVSSQCEVPVIGFCGSPWTVATYMVEGKSSRNFAVIKKMLYEAPQILLSLLNKLAKASQDYLYAQVQAGAKALMIFDTWGGVLSPSAYQQFSLHYMQSIVTFLKTQPLTQDIPIILFTKQGGQWLEAMAQSGCDALGIDWTQSLKDARLRVGDKVALQGNLDPSILLTTPSCIETHVKSILEEFGFGSGHIFNLGHGITPDVPPENVQAVIEMVHRYSPAYQESA